MAIAFNLPSEREANEENFSRLNRLLAELYEVLCHILVSRQPGQEVHENRRDRPFSESDIEGSTASAAPEVEQRRRSASTPPILFALPSGMEDDVFVSLRTDNGNDPFSTRNVEIFGHRSPRTPAGVMLSPTRERPFTFNQTSEKYWRDKGGTEAAAVAAGGNQDADVTDAASTADEATDSSDVELTSDRSMFSDIIPYNVSGPICTAIILMLGWKLLFYKRFSELQPAETVF